MALWLRQSVSHDTGLPVQPPNPTEFTLGHNVASKADVDEVMKRAADAGAVILKAARDTLWGGYAGYFQDPGQHGMESTNDSTRRSIADYRKQSCKT